MREREREREHVGVPLCTARVVRWVGGLGADGSIRGETAPGDQRNLQRGGGSDHGPGIRL